MNEWHDSLMQHFLTDETDPRFPEHTNIAIELNRMMAASNLFRVEHTNGNHTICVNDHVRITTSTCDAIPVHVSAIQAVSA
jgi:hypothetical protein